MSVAHTLGNHDSLIVVQNSSKNLIGTSIQKSYESHPTVLFVLETHNITL